MSDSAHTGAASALTIASIERLPRALQERHTCVLIGERLARLNTLRRVLQGRPHAVELHLDATDRLLWDVAIAEAGIMPAGSDGATLKLGHRPATAAPAKEACA